MDPVGVQGIAVLTSRQKELLIVCRVPLNIGLLGRFLQDEFSHPGASPIGSIHELSLHFDFAVPLAALHIEGVLVTIQVAAHKDVLEKYGNVVILHNVKKALT